MSTDDTTVEQAGEPAPIETPANEVPPETGGRDPAEAPGGAPPPAWALAVAGVASIGAGVIHATATGTHNEHRQAAVAFAVLAALQVGWGALALVRPWRRLGLAGAAVNAAAVAGWVLAKTSGISFIDGFEEAESVQFADAAAAALGAVAVAAALIGLVPRLTWARRPQPVLTGMAVLATLGLAIPGMVTAGNHAHGAGHGGDHGETAGHDDGHGDHGEQASVVPPKPYDGTLPVDLSGVPGVTREQQEEAEELLTRAIRDLPAFADYRVAEEQGYHSIGDGVTGFEHFVNWRMVDDEHVLDPAHPESLVYRVEDGERELVAAMMLLRSEDTLETVPAIGGDLIQWHIHDDLCYRGEPLEWTLGGVAPPPQECPPGTFRFEQNVPMMHIWIVPHVCGPFAALEGVGGGQIPEGEERACDHHHGANEGTPGAVLSEGDGLAARRGG